MKNRIILKLGLLFSVSKSSKDDSIVIQDDDPLVNFSIVNEDHFEQQHVDYSSPLPVLAYRPAAYSFEQVAAISRKMRTSSVANPKKFDSLQPMKDEPSLWFYDFEARLNEHGAIQMAKEIIMDFLDEVGLDFYYKITR